MLPSNSFADLNADQARAAQHGAGGGPLLIIAGAGSGKTQTLAHRVAYLISEGADPSRILLLTFSRRAAQEMERRVERILTGCGMSRGWPPSAGPAPFTLSVHDFYATSRIPSASTQPSPFTTGRIPLTC